MPPSASNCLPDLLGKARIRFESGKADIVADSAGLLDRLIETALRCPTANIEIAGHTDTDGDEAANQALSEKRAQAVADYLVKAGLPANRFSAVGYGIDAADRRQRYRRRQGAEPPHRFRGEVSDGLSGDILLGLAAGIAAARLRHGLDLRGSARRGRHREAWRWWLAALAAALVAAALARVVPGRFGYWLDLGLIMFALYLCGLCGRIMVARLGGFAQRAARPDRIAWRRSAHQPPPSRGSVTAGSLTGVPGLVPDVRNRATGRRRMQQNCATAVINCA